ncbi:DJ-1/PfpI family protein [Paenibacillus senegalensis]|uniref:DJ-1/PfpI family protein n=1 Tax=Paenibacillus senegalensis TaxID=1465766 RepID=UPI0002895C93|nr:DJ-1/PfpI family protein [Paenibacillus senegalensis]
MRTVQIVLFDGFDLLDAIAPYEVFCAAALYTDNMLTVEFVTAEGPRSVTSGINGVKLEATGRLNPGASAIILVPGASGNVHGDGPDSVPSILSQAMKTELTGLIKQALGQKSTVIATVCGGSLVLALGGLLEGRPAVTNRLGMSLLESTGAIPVQARIVDDGNLVTSGGVTSGLDIALYLVERELGPRIAHAVELLFEFERRGTVWRDIGLPPDVFPAVKENDKPRNETDSTAEYEETEKSQTTQASVFDGVWDTTIATPVGKLEVKLSITASNGVVQGTAAQGNEISEFINPVLMDNKLTWSLRITKPMRINLKFEVEVDGERMTGSARAGILPASQLTGIRSPHSRSAHP